MRKLRKLVEPGILSARTPSLLNRLATNFLVPRLAETSRSRSHDVARILRDTGELDRHGRAASRFALDLDLPAVLDDHTVSDAQTQTRATMTLASGKKRVEHSFLMLARDAATIVLDLKPNELALGESCQDDPRRPGIDGVGDHDDDDFLERCRAELHRRQ